jgi:hypothetical protein
MQLFHIKTTVDSNVFSQKFEPHTLNFIDPIFSYTYIETIRVSFTKRLLLIVISSINK